MSIKTIIFKLFKSNKKSAYKHLKKISSKKLVFPVEKEKQKDSRNYKYVATISPNETITQIDLSPKFNSIRNQLSLGSCQSFAVISVLEYLWNKDKNETQDLSEKYTYYAIRYWNGDEDKNVGATIFQAVKSPFINGYCFEDNFPYDLNYKEYPPMKARIAAGMLKLYLPKSYWEVNMNIDDVKQCLRDGNPVIFGMTLYSSFNNTTSIVPTPKTNESVLGGHAMVIVGFDDEKSCFKVRNSWGSAWGDNGYCWLPYILFAKYAFDPYIIK